MITDKTSHELICPKKRKCAKIVTHHSHVNTLPVNSQEIIFSRKLKAVPHPSKHLVTILLSLSYSKAFGIGFRF